MDESQRLPSTATYGAEIVQAAFQKFRETPTARTRQIYEQEMLRYIYYHNRYTGHIGCFLDCETWQQRQSYYAQLFWVGISTKKDISFIEPIAAQAKLDKP